MLTAIFILITIFIAITVIFSFPQFSPIPYYPSNKKDMKLILKALNIKNNQIIIDFGAGDGIVIFEAAKKAYKEKLNTKFIALEINPILILILYIKRLFNPNKNNIQIMLKDIFKKNLDLKLNVRYLTFYLYISPWFLEKALKNIKNIKKKNINIVSYYYEVKSLKRIQKKTKGKNNIFSYNL